MSQVTVPKISAYVAMGPEADSVVVTKLSMYVLLVPGNDSGEGDGVNRQSFAYAQRFRRTG